MADNLGPLLAYFVKARRCIVKAPQQFSGCRNLSIVEILGRVRYVSGQKAKELTTFFVNSEKPWCAFEACSLEMVQ